MDVTKIHEIGKQLKKIRKTQGFTQKDIAEYLGVTIQAISNWEIRKVLNIKISIFIKN